MLSLQGKRGKEKRCSTRSPSPSSLPSLYLAALASAVLFYHGRAISRLQLQLNVA